MPLSPYNLPTEFFNLVGIPEWMWIPGTESMPFQQRAALFSNYLAQNPDVAQGYLQKAAELGIPDNADYAAAQSILQARFSALPNMGEGMSLMNNGKTSSYNPFGGGTPGVTPGPPPGPGVTPPPPPPPTTQDTTRRRIVPNEGIQTPPPPAPTPNRHTSAANTPFGGAGTFPGAGSGGTTTVAPKPTVPPNNNNPGVPTMPTPVQPVGGIPPTGVGRPPQNPLGGGPRRLFKGF